MKRRATVANASLGRQTGPRRPRTPQSEWAIRGECGPPKPNVKLSYRIESVELCVTAS